MKKSKEDSFATDEHGNEEKQKKHLPRTNTENKNKSISPRRRKERKGKQEIQTCLLLLRVLSVFAVKILGDLASKEEAFATDEHGITRKKSIKAFHREDAKNAK